MFNPRKIVAALAVTVVAAGLCASTATSANALTAQNKQSVISYLSSISGSKIISGQHNKEPATQPSQYTDVVHTVTGKYPGLWGGDMMFNPDDVANRQKVIDQAKQEWANGSIVALTWHACSPTVAATCAFDGGVKTNITDQQFQDIVTGGTALNATWKSRMAAVVPYLKQLKDAGIPVLWRPFHEMNESWNWWGNRPGANGGAKIYQQMRDYFDSQGLDNLIWVWNVQDNPAGGWVNYYPGDNYVDVVSLDSWYKSYPSAADYQQIQAIAKTKPMAIAEMGTVPTEAFLASQPKWSYFMIWSEYINNGTNSNAAIQATYNNPRVLNQGQVAIGSTSGGTPPTGTAKTGPITGLAGKCVDVAGSGTVNSTAVQLYTCSAGVAQTWTVGTDGTVRNPNSGRCLDVIGQGTANGTKVQIYDCNGKTNQKWVYNSTTQALKDSNSGRCLDVTGEATTDKTPLQIYDCNGKGNQKWVLPTGA